MCRSGVKKENTGVDVRTRYLYCPADEMSRATVLVLIVIAIIAGGVRPDEVRFLTRQNYGFVLRSKGQIQLTSGYMRFIFHTAVPTVMTYSHIERVDCSHFSAQPRLFAKCQSAQNVTNSLFRMRHDVLSLIADRMAEINSMLHQMPQRRARQTRSSFGAWLGSGLADVFSLATHGQLEDVERLLQNVLEGTQKAIETFAHGENLVTRIATLTNERFENMNQILNLTERTIHEEHTRLMAMRDRQDGITLVMADIVEEIHLAIKTVQQVEALYLGVQQLQQGKLSCHMIPPETLRWAILDTMTLLREKRPHLQLIHHDEKFYYEVAKFKAAVHKTADSQVLFVTVLAPVTMRRLRVPLTVWEILKFPLKAPDDQGYYTMLKTSIKYVAYHHATDYYMTAVNDGELMPRLGGVVDIHKTSLKLYSKYELTCALALFGTDLESIQTHCGYTVVFDDLPPSVVRINANKLLLTNVTQILVERRGRENVTALHQQINFTQAHVIYNMPCESRILAEGEFFHSNEHCLDDETQEVSNVTYPVNVAVLRQYFSNNSLLDKINHAMEMSFSITARLPLLEIDKPQYEGLLARDEKFSFDFEQIKNATEQDKAVYNSLSHMIWAKMVQNAAEIHSFNPLSPYHWLTIIAIVATTINIVVVSRLYFKYRALSLLVFSLPKVRSQFVVTTTGATSSEDEKFHFHQFWTLIQENVASQISTEFILCLMLLVLIVLMVLAIKHTCLGYAKNQTVLKLYLRAGKLQFQCKVTELQFSSQFYRFEVTQTVLEHTKTFFGSCLIWGRGIRVTDLALNRGVDLKTTLILLPWQSKAVDRIMHHVGAEAYLLLTDEKGVTIESMILWRSGVEQHMSGSLYPQIQPMV